MVQNLILVAAPSCCGKTTFVKQLRRGELETIQKRMEVNDLKAWLYRDIYLHEKEILELEQLQQCRLILHYTIPYPALKYILRKGYDKKERLTIIRGASEIKLLTLYASPSTLLRRLELRRQRVDERRRQGLVPIHKYASTLRTLKRLKKVYSSPNKLTLMYRNWFDHCYHINLNSHFLVNVEGSPRLEELSVWPQVTNMWKINGVKANHGV